MIVGLKRKTRGLEKVMQWKIHLRILEIQYPLGGSGLSVLVEKCQKMTGVFVDGIHGTPYIFYIAPWILWDMKVPHASTSWNFGLVCLWNWKVHSSFLSLIRFEFASKSGMSHDSTFFSTREHDFLKLIRDSRFWDTSIPVCHVESTITYWLSMVKWVKHSTIGHPQFEGTTIDYLTISSRGISTGISGP